ncbi:MAG: efflux RND transporter periplasmic adaptor subunit [Paludisphaera borealis]|uniref:efflux RND transporter periplasmic adaptor subunit n=1 Tax=Paludisphaera borealis TaxID=1387353 RepID=UPI00283E514F|nr:efflux RND transporter periplasmic adaptor subunit [Paludisphaera borealis]MDR3622559.1 efflux RND transporter periplasmic adaptor subunit [Paludisphaera borealis]
MKHRYAVILALGAAVGQAGCSHEGAKASSKADVEAKPVPVTVAPLERRTVERTIEAVGSLRGWEQVTIGAKRSGKVLKVYHDMGDRVRPDEPLVQLDPIDAKLAFDVAQSKYLAELVKLGISAEEADEFIKRYGVTEALIRGKQAEEAIGQAPAVRQVQAAMEKSLQNLARQRALSKKGAGTAQELGDQENDYQAAMAAYDNAKATARNVIAMAIANRIARDQAQQTMADLTIRSPHPQVAPPIPGRPEATVYAVTQRSVSEGQILKEGDAVYDLVIENPLRLWTNVPERYTTSLRAGQPVRVSVASHPGKVFEGKVARINPSVDPTSRTFQVETQIPNSEGLLRPGGFAKATIITDATARAAVVPIESIIQFAGVTKLFLVENDKVRAIDDLVLGKEGSGWVEVSSASLPETGTVVTTGQSLLANGTSIVVRPPAPDAGPKHKTDETQHAAAEAKALPAR